jgi:hypothetical protein
MAARRLSSIVGGKQNEAFDSNVANETKLAQMGYEQGKSSAPSHFLAELIADHFNLAELKRSFSLLGMVGFSFSIVTCWTALGGTLIVGITSGGPPVMVWSWVGICLLSLCVAYSFAEMCSACKSKSAYTICSRVVKSRAVVQRTLHS